MPFRPWPKQDHLQQNQRQQGLGHENLIQLRTRPNPQDRQQPIRKHHRQQNDRNRKKSPKLNLLEMQSQRCRRSGRNEIRTTSQTKTHESQKKRRRRKNLSTANRQ